MTLKRFIAEHTRPGCSYIIETTGHVVFAEDGLIIDQIECAEPETHWARNKIVRRRYLLERK